jgi:hypothetical protein
MDVIWGVVLIGLGLLAWGGQAVAWFAPATAVRLSLTEAEESVEPVYWADGRGEALWDVVSLWTLPLAGLLLVVAHEAWAWLGLIGGGMYIYFAGRGLLSRLELQRSGFTIGEPSNVRLGHVMLGVWGLAGLITIVAAVSALT